MGVMGTLAPAASKQNATKSAFEEEVASIVSELHAALAQIITSLRPPVRRAADLRRLLNLGQKVSWSLYTAAESRDRRALASLLPGRRGMERFLQAASEHGAPAPTIDRMRQAFERFEAAVARHAGSRDAFETMVGELAGGRGGAETGTRGSDQRHKRAAFRALSLLWGQQARVVCGARIMHPSATPARLDSVFLKGMVGLHRTRRTGPLHTTAYRARVVPQTGGAQVPPPQPLDPRETGPDAIGLLHDFCSRPLPEFRLRESGQGYRSHELVVHDLGPSGEVTYFTGEVGRADTVPDGEVAIGKAVDFPFEVFMGDILMHRSLGPPRTPAAAVYAVPVDGSLGFREADRLPLSEAAEYLGEGLYAARTTEVPRYTEMLEYAMGRMGWNPDEFHVFRCRVEYPVLSSRIRVWLK